MEWVFLRLGCSLSDLSDSNSGVRAEDSRQRNLVTRSKPVCADYRDACEVWNRSPFWRCSPAFEAMGVMRNRMAALVSRGLHCFSPRRVGIWPFRTTSILGMASPVAYICGPGIRQTRYWVSTRLSYASFGPSAVCRRFTRVIASVAA